MMNHSNIENLYPRISTIRSALLEIQSSNEVSIELKRKQNLLKVEIHDYYEANQNIMELFIAYFKNQIQQKTGHNIDEPDLNLVTQKQLQQMVVMFKQRINQRLKQLQRQKHQQDSLKSSLVIHSILADQLDQQNHQKTFYNNNAWDYSIVLDNLSCKQEKAIFNSENIKLIVQLKNSQIRRQRLFFQMAQKKDLWIEVYSEYGENKKIVKRSIEDFQFLQYILRHKFPHAFVPSLKITEQEIKYFEQEHIKDRIFRKCAAFIQKILNVDLLRENVFFFRFLIQEKEKNYQEHKQRNLNQKVKNFQQYSNLKGKIRINISPKAQVSKIGLDKISETLQQKCKNISNLTLEIGKKIRSVEQQMFNLTKQLRQTQEMIKHQQSKLSLDLKPLCKLFEAYQKFVTITAISLQNYQKTLLQIKQSSIEQSFINWQQFNKYKQELFEESQQYQRKRKLFLEKIANKFKKFQNDIVKISLLDLRRNDEQLEWIERQALWYGHISPQLNTNFQQFLEKETHVLKNTLEKCFDKFKQYLEQQSVKLQQINMIFN